MSNLLSFILFARKEKPLNNIAYIKLAQIYDETPLPIANFYQVLKSVSLDYII